MKNPIVATIALLSVLAIGIGIGTYATAPTGRVPASAKEAGRGTDKEAGEKEREEGGVAMSDAKVAASGIEVLKAGEQTLKDSLVLNGIIQPNQETLVQVTPRFPGVVREIRKRIGEPAAQGELLARIESNQSLTTYDMRAPISGTVIDRQISLGEYASEQKPAFVVADIATVWIDLSVYRRDLPRVKVGDGLVVDPGDGGPPIDAKISYVSPVGNSDTQSALVRAVVPNAGLRLRAGLFVSARLLLAEKKVSVAVSSSALQTIENRTVVFVRSGDRFEARDVEIGQRDADSVEITFGVLEGDMYAGRNSYIVKAEMAKGGADND